MADAVLEVLDVRFDNLSQGEALARATTFLDSNRLHQIVTPGPEFVLEATANPRFRSILRKADLSLADGMGVHVAALLRGRRLKSRVPGVDFIHGLLRIAAEKNKSVFLLGGLRGAVEGSAVALMHKYPGLRIVGAESGFRGPWQKLHDRQIVRRIHQAKPDILLVALGAPKQELWIETHRQALHGVKIAMGVGRTLDYMAGLIKRPPAVVRKLGFEWLDTYIRAGRYYQSSIRRQRVRNATIHFLFEVVKPRKPHAS